MRNPDWVRDEIILAMDLYVRADRKQLPPGHEEVVKLSQLLNRLPLHPDSVRSGTFRNAAGISMILGNFLSIDPLCDQPGLSRSNQLQAVVWDDFIDDLPLLHRTAQTIQRVGSGVENDVDEEAAQAEESFREGHLLARLHIARERNRAVVAAKIDHAWRGMGRITCEACDFDFLVFYGELGRGFAECHHLIPLADASLERSTRIDDLSIVCANCHRMLHRGRPMLSPGDLRSVIDQAKRMHHGGVL